MDQNTQNGLHHIDSMTSPTMDKIQRSTIQFGDSPILPDTTRPADHVMKDVFAKSGSSSSVLPPIAHGNYEVRKATMAQKQLIEAGHPQTMPHFNSNFVDSSITGLLPGALAIMVDPRINLMLSRLTRIPPSPPKLGKIDASIYFQECGIFVGPNMHNRSSLPVLIVAQDGPEAYALKDPLGFMVSAQDVHFLEKYSTHNGRLRAASALRAFQLKHQQQKDRQWKKDMIAWRRNERQHQLEIVMREVDRDNMAIFRPGFDPATQLPATKLWIQKQNAQEDIPESFGGYPAGFTGRSSDEHNFIDEGNFTQIAQFLESKNLFSYSKIGWGNKGLLKKTGNDEPEHRNFRARFVRNHKPLELRLRSIAIGNIVNRRYEVWEEIIFDYIFMTYEEKLSAVDRIVACRDSAMIEEINHLVKEITSTTPTSLEDSDCSGILLDLPQPTTYRVERSKYMQVYLDMLTPCFDLVRDAKTVKKSIAPDNDFWQATEADPKPHPKSAIFMNKIPELYPKIKTPTRALSISSDGESSATRSSEGSTIIFDD